MILENKENKKEKETIDEIYEIAPISKLEFMIYLTYWLGLVLAGCFSVYKLANNPRTLEYFIEGHKVVKSHFGLYESTYEYMWKSIEKIINNSFLPVSMYILFSKFLRSNASPKIFMCGCITLSIYLNYYYSSLSFLKLQIVILIIPSIAGFLRLKSLVWISGLYMLYNMKELPDLEFYQHYYLFEFIYSYIGLMITRAISVGLTIADAPKYDFKFFLEMLFYYWYFPAIIGVRMMVVKDFINNIYQPYIIQDWKKWFFLAFRVTIVYNIWKIVTIFVPFYLVFMTHDIKTLDVFVLTGGQLYYGIHYSVTYMILYNLSILVKQLDGFITSEGPECICHIALYNRLWKSFDIAMHLWIKDHIFRPIARSGDFRITKFPAIVASFLFVVIFHGFRKETVLWISLNIGQFIIYDYLIFGFHNSSWGHFMQKKFSPALNRHIIAIVGAISWLTSIYGFGAFCYGLEKINEMHMTSFKRDSNPYYYRALMVAFCCYCHSQICLTVNDYLLKRKKKIL